MGVAKKVWLPLLIVFVVVVAGVTVSRIRTFFGSEGIIETPRNFADLPEPFDPKEVRYEISGNGSYADINYLDLDAKPQRVDGAALPWSLNLRPPSRRPRPTSSPRATAAPSPAASFVDNELKDEKTNDGLECADVLLCEVRMSAPVSDAPTEPSRLTDSRRAHSSRG